MEDYFKDLLTDPQHVTEDTSTSHSLPEKPVSPPLKKKTQIEVDEKKFADLEHVKREKLQIMLNQPLQALPEEKTKTAVQEDIALPAGTLPLNEITEAMSVETETLEIAENKIAQAQLSENEQALSVNDMLQWSDNGRPVWAQEKFDVLLFDVLGLTLAVPLVALGQIVTLDSSLTPVFGQSQWFMGLMPSNQGDIKTVNTALFVMPEKYDKRFLDSAKFVVSIDGMRWGLAVDNVNQPVSLTPDDVKWRGQRTSRPWLAGTVKSKMCALLDIPQVGKLLNSSDKNTDKNILA